MDGCHSETYGIGNWVTTPDNNGHWFDGCDHDVILFDDVETGIPSPSFFKRLTVRLIDTLYKCLLKTDL
jgi:hypothetical protein